LKHTDRNDCEPSPEPRIGGIASVLRFFGVTLAAALSFAPLSAWEVRTIGNTIEVKVGAGLSGQQCCRGASIDEPGEGATCSQSCPANSEITRTFTCNSVGTHVVYGYWSDDNTDGRVIESKTIEVTEPPPPTCPLFDFYVTGSRVLTHKYGATDAYPSGQTADAEIELKLRPRRAVAGTTIYLRVFDPPDSAPYGPEQPRPPDDNVDTAANAGTISGGKLATATLLAAGITAVKLRTTETVAGDNYEVRATPNVELHTNPNFVCDTTTNCLKTPVITAWKRIYIEGDRMFRRGAYITGDVMPCSTGPCFVPLSNLRGIGRGDLLRVIHAPRFNFVGPQQFYSEDVEVLRVERKNARVEVTPFQNAYFGPDSTVGTGPLPYLADAVGIIGGNEAEDLYTPNTQLISPLFDGTFVEHVFLQDDPVPYLPFEQELLGGGLSGDEATAIARKWFLNFTRSNHQHLLTARVHFDDTIQGLTTARIGTNWSWIFVDTVNDSSPRGAREWLFNGEVTSHEIAHQWQVNPIPVDTTRGHCTSFRWNSATLYCSMHGDYGALGGTLCHGTCPEFFDGQVGFHYQSPTDSEYTFIRQRPEPVPQF
jgi:hypothetical protein